VTEGEGALMGGTPGQGGDPAPADESVQSAVRKLADKKPETLVEFMKMEMSAGGNPLHRKMTSEHISQVLDLAAKHDEREYDLQKSSQEHELSEGRSNRLFCFLAFVVLVALVLVVLILFKEKPETLIPILSGLGGLVSGFLGGYGLGAKKRS